MIRAPCSTPRFRFFERRRLFPQHVDRWRLHPGLQGHRTAARHGLFAHVRRRPADGRVPGRVQDPELHAAPVRRGRVLASLRAGRVRIQGPARARRSARAGRRRDGHDGLVPLGRDDHRRDRGAVARLPVRAGLSRRRRPLRPDGRNAALDVPLHPVHIAGRARRGRAEQLRQVCGAGDHVDAHEPRHDRVRRLDCATLRAPWHRAGDRRARFGHRAAGIPAAVHDQARPVATAALALGTRGRAQDRAADAAGHFWLVRVAGFVAARYVDRFVPHDGQHRLAVLRRPARRISAWRIQHRARHRDPARTRVASRRAVAGTIRVDARLGHQADDDHRVARDGRAARAGRPADGHDLPLRRVRRAGRAHVDARADGVFLRADGLQHGQGAGARLLRAPGHQDPGTHRRAVARPSTWG